jgi:hypothetical protein
LIGNSNKLPARYIHSNPLLNFDIIRNLLNLGCSIASDLYYASLYDSDGNFSSWDSNNNDKFGEIKFVRNNISFFPILREKVVDEIDLRPDVYIGRLLCNNSREVELIVDKIINYENNTYGKEWFNNIILTGGNEHQLWKQILSSILFKKNSFGWEGQIIGNKISEIMSEFNAIKLYASANRRLINNIFRSNEYLPLTKDNIANSFRDGAGFAAITAYGNPLVWVTNPPAIFPLRLYNRIKYEITDVRNLDNKEKLPVLVLTICSGADFSKFSKTNSPIAWEYVKHESGGSIATFGYSNVIIMTPGISSTDQYAGYVTTKLFEAYSKGYNTPGSMCSYAINSYLDEHDFLSIYDPWAPIYPDYNTIQALTLFGDPSLRIGGYP